MKTPKLILTLLSGTVILIACSVVSLKPGAENVSIAATKSSLTECKSLGRINVSLWSKMTSIQSHANVETELNTLARNSAVEIGGNAIVPDSKISDGQRSYLVYKCISS